MKISLKNRLQFNFIRYVEHFTPFKLNKQNIQKKILEELEKFPKGELKKVRRVEDITLKEFRKNYLSKGIPVVLEGFAKSWNCVKSWTPDSLSERFGNDKLILIDDDSYELTYTNLKEVLYAMEIGDKSKYSRFNTLLYDHPELKKDFDFKWMQKARNLLSSGKTMQVFLGAKDSHTKLHAASEHNLFTQVYGSKHWYLISPKLDPILRPLNIRAPYFHTDFDPANIDYKKFPAAKFIDIYECTLKPGDVLFNPPSYWHQIYNPEASIGVGFRWFNLYDSMKLNFSQSFLTLFAINPTIFTASKHRENFVKIFEKLNKKS